jgi:hypothetical protein
VTAYAAWREWWTERAAIGECEGNLSRRDAELQADRIAGPAPGTQRDWLADGRGGGR